MQLTLTLFTTTIPKKKEKKRFYLLLEIVLVKIFRVHTETV